MIDDTLKYTIVTDGLMVVLVKRDIMKIISTQIVDTPKGTREQSATGTTSEHFENPCVI